MQWPYGIGLDIGVASVGWAVVALDEQAQPCGLIRLGSRVFDKAEQSRGESLAAPRRQARSMRRRLRRKALRRQDIYALLPRHGLPGQAELAALFQTGHLEDIYALRARALDEPVAPAAFARILLHLSQRRGFRSNRLDESSREDGRLLAAVRENRACMEQNGYRTAGEMYAKDPRFAGHKRNKADSYLATVSRDDVEQEVNLLFAAQRGFGQVWATPELKDEYLSILRRQRSFDEGPGGNSPYRGGWADRVGHCTLLPKERRACKNCYSFELFALLQKINHIRLVQNGETRPLTQEQRDTLRKLAHQTDSLPYPLLRKKLALGDDVLFSEVRYEPGKTAAACEKKYKLPAMQGYHKLRRALGADPSAAPARDRLDAIAQVLCLFKNKDTRTEKLLALGLDRDTAQALPAVNFSGFGHLSVKACRMLEPHLLQGMTYDQACTAAGLDFHGHRSAPTRTLPASAPEMEAHSVQGSHSLPHTLPASAPEMEEITSPVVRRAVSQTIKVVNAIIREMNKSPVYVHIELARDLSRSFDERIQLEKAMQENAAENERLMRRLREEFQLSSPTGQDLVKFRLWNEQGGVCAYSLQQIPIERLFEHGYAEVDHIIPYSRSFDDTRSNKVLVLASENRQKGNHLPLEYLQGEKRERFIVWTNTTVRNFRKRQNLLKPCLTREEQDRFIQRNLQDTQHMASFLLNYIRDHLAFADHPAAGRQRVTALSGGVTAHLRKRWGLTKIREDGDLHHALDAAVIACATQGMVGQISGYYHRIEGQYIQAADGSSSAHSRTKERFPAPWPHFRDDLDIRLSPNPQAGLMAVNPVFYRNFDVSRIQPVFVSRMPRHKVTGPAHEETVKGIKALPEGVVAMKRPLTELELDKDQQIANYYMPASDTLLYEALRAQLIRYGGNAAKAFAEPFHKPKADGSPGPIVRKVKICEKATLPVPLHGGTGAAKNADGSMVRIDVFHVPGDGYYLVPIYVSDTCKPELPNRAVVQKKPCSEWKEMQEEDFLFSLYKNDLIEVEHKKEMVFHKKNKGSPLSETWTTSKAMVYYTEAHIATAAISICTHDNAYTVSSLGFKTLKSVRKYQVDVLGNISEVKKETRQRFR